MALLAVRRLLGLPVTADLLDLDGSTGTVTRVHQSRDPHCPYHRRLPAARPLALGPDPSVADLLAALPPDATPLAWRPFQLAVACPRCGLQEERPGRVVPADCTAAEIYPGNGLLQSFVDAPANAVRAIAGQRAIFLSYATADRTTVDALYAALTAPDIGVATFQDHRSVAPGRNWLDTIRDGASSAAALVCWVTPSFLERPFCSYEIGIAEISGASIVPIWVDGLSPGSAPSYLSGRQGRRSDAPHDFRDLAIWLAASV